MELYSRTSDIGIAVADFSCDVVICAGKLLWILVSYISGVYVMQIFLLSELTQLETYLFLITYMLNDT